MYLFINLFFLGTRGSFSMSNALLSFALQKPQPGWIASSHAWVTACQTGLQFTYLAASPRCPSTMKWSMTFVVEARMLSSANLSSLKSGSPLQPRHYPKGTMSCVIWSCKAMLVITQSRYQTLARGSGTETSNNVDDQLYITILLFRITIFFIGTVCKHLSQIGRHTN